jgi:hypothetical protein
MGKSAILLMGSIILLAFLLFLGSGAAEARVVINQDLVVNADISWADETYEVHGNITVLGGVTFHMYSVTLEMVGTENGSRTFELQEGAILLGTFSTIIGRPWTIGLIFNGMSNLVDTELVNVWDAPTTQGIYIGGLSTWTRVVVRGSPNGTAVRVNGTLQATDCTFKDMGEVIMSFWGPHMTLDSYLVRSTFEPSPTTTLTTMGVFLYWIEDTATDDQFFNVTGCTFSGLSTGIDATVNMTRGILQVIDNEFDSCDRAIRVTGNKAHVIIRDISTETTGGQDGINIFVTDPLLDPIDLELDHVTIEGFTNGIYILGPAQRFKPVVHNVTVVGCTNGVRVLGSTVFIEDSNVTNNGVCFFSENKGRIEVRRTEHEHQSGSITQQAAIVAYSIVSVVSAKWKDGYVIDEGYIQLNGEDGVWLERVDLADPQPTEVVTWSLTKFNDLGRLLVIPTYEVGSDDFVASGFDIYNMTPQDVEIEDHIAPNITDLWPEDGQWFNYSQVNVTGNVLERGSGLASMAATIIGGEELVVTWNETGAWAVTFGAVTDGILDIEITATDMTGNSTKVNITGIKVDTTFPTIELDKEEYLVSTTDITINGTTEPLARVHIWEAGVPPDHPYMCDDNVTADENGTFEMTLCLGAGIHLMNITATDRAGNVAEGTFQVSMDPYYPSLIINSPEDGIWSSHTSIQIVIMLYDNGTSLWTEIWLEGREPSRGGLGPIQITAQLVEGENTIIIWARDEAGNTVNRSRRITVDSIPPVLSVDSPRETAFSTTEPKVDLQGEVVEANLLQLTLNGVELDVYDGIFTGTLLINEGESVFTIEASDLAGNTDSWVITVQKDTVAPIYTFEANIPGGEILVIDDVVFGKFTEDGESQLEVTFTMNEWSRIVAVGGLGQKEGEGTITFLLDLEEGSNTFSFTLEDEVGNSASSASYSIILDTTPPEIKVDGPVDVKTKDRNYRIRGQVEPGSSLTIDGEDVVVNTDGSFNIQVDLDMGENTFQLQAIDVVGQTNSYYVKVVRQKESDDSPGMGAPTVLVAMALLTFAMASRRRL